jgi:hypothetical protein
LSFAYSLIPSEVVEAEPVNEQPTSEPMAAEEVEEITTQPEQIAPSNVDIVSDLSTEYLLTNNLTPATMTAEQKVDYVSHLKHELESNSSILQRNY